MNRLLVEQVEYAKVIPVSRIDRIGEAEFVRLRAALASLNPSARFLPMANGKFDPSEVLHTGRFDLPALVKSPGWM